MMDKDDKKKLLKTCENLILSGNIYKEEARQVYDLTGGVVEACVNSLRHIDVSRLRLVLDDCFLEYLEQKIPYEDKFLLAIKDKSHVLLAYLVSRVKYSDMEITNLINSSNKELSEIGVGLSIVNELPELIPASNNDALYKYFRTHKIKTEALSTFSSADFINFLLKEMLNEDRVIFNWMITNLKSLIENNSLEVHSNYDFLVRFLRSTQHQNGSHKELYRVALMKDPHLVDKLSGIRFEIDPFTKQINYTKWLGEVRLFKFVYDLCSHLPKDYSSHSLSGFKAKMAVFLTINKGDNFLF